MAISRRSDRRLRHSRHVRNPHNQMIQSSLKHNKCVEALFSEPVSYGKSNNDGCSQLPPLVYGLQNSISPAIGDIKTCYSLFQYRCTNHL